MESMVGRVRIRRPFTVALVALSNELADRAIKSKHHRHGGTPLEGIQNDIAAKDKSATRIVERL